MENTIKNNLQMWNVGHHWSDDGDEWNGQARICGVPYEDWKKSVIDKLIKPNCADRIVVEIAPGYGRWSVHMAPIASELHLVDISENCISACKHRLSTFHKVKYYINDGKRMPFMDKKSVDFVFSFDAFVHMDQNTISSYFREFKRIMRPEARAIIHHANRRALYLAFLRKLGPMGTRLYRIISQGTFRDDDGWRSNISAKVITRLAQSAGFVVDDQFVFWAKGYGVPRYHDCITVLRNSIT